MKKNSTQVHRKKTVSCGACVYRIIDVNDKRSFQILLVRPWAERDAWGIPKGHLNEGENFVACAHREVLEEAGIIVELEDQLLPVSTNYKDEQKTVHAWIAKQACATDAYAKDGENVDVRWFEHDSLPNLHVYQRPLVAQAIAIIKHKVIYNPLSVDEDFYIEMIKRDEKENS